MEQNIGRINKDQFNNHKMQKKYKVIKEAVKWLYKDIEKNKIIYESYGMNPIDFKDGFGVVSFNGKKGYINDDFEKITEIKYEIGSDFCEGKAMVGQNQNIGSVIKLRKGFIDTTGMEIIPLVYKEAFSFNGGIAVVKLGDLWGGIDSNNIDVIHFEYDYLEGFSEDFARARIGKKWGFINRVGVIKIGFKYDRVENFSAGLAKVILNSRIGSVDRSGLEYWHN